MNKILILLILFSTNVGAKSTIIAQIDLDRSLVQMYDYKEVTALIAKFVDQKNKKLDYEYEQLEKLKKEYLESKNSKILDKINEHEKIYNSKSISFQQEINNYAESQKGPLLRKLIKFSQEYAKKNNIDFLLDTNKSILYEKNKVIDLTNDILRAYNSNKNK